MRVTLLLLSLLSLTEAFVAPKQALLTAPRMSAFSAPTTALFALDENNADHENDPFSGLSLPSVAASTAAFWSLSASMAGAAGPDWGIFEGRTLSLLHPAMMLGMLGLSVSTALLGFNWRRQRTIGDEISDMKKRLPSLDGAKTVSEAIANAKAAESVDSALVSKLEAALPVQKEIDELTSERKALSQGNNRERHWNQGATLAFIGTAFAIEVRKTLDYFHLVSLLIFFLVTVH